MHTVETLGYDRETMFPAYHQAAMDGRALINSAAYIEATQDRVAMRRYLRQHHAAALGAMLPTIKTLPSQALSDLINVLESDNVAP